MKISQSKNVSSSENETNIVRSSTENASYNGETSSLSALSELSTKRKLNRQLGSIIQ